MYEVLTLQKLDIQGVGLINISRIKELFPNLVYLDVRDNKIFSFDVIEHLRKLEEFADINLLGNPICMHKHLKDEILEYMPNIERVNGEQIHISRYKYAQQAKELRQQMDSLSKQKSKTESDRYLEEYKSKAEIQEIIKELKDLDADEEAFQLGN